MNTRNFWPRLLWRLGFLTLFDVIAFFIWTQLLGQTASLQMWLIFAWLLAPAFTLLEKPR